QGGDVGRGVVGLLETVEGDAGKSLVAHTESVPDVRIIGSSVGQFAILGGCLFEAGAGDQSVSEHSAKLVVLWLAFEGGLEMRGGLAIAARHALGDCEIENEAVVAGESLYDILVDRNGLVVLARLHQFGGALRFPGLIFGLRLKGYGETKKGEPQS